MGYNDWVQKRFGSKPAKQSVNSTKQVLKSTQQIIDEEIKLQKAIKDSDWSKVWLMHSDDQKSKVDHTYHVVNSKVSPDYHKMFNDVDRTHESVADPGNGISAKMIHKVGDDHYMTKPYHPKRDVPLAGWGIMTTHNLYKSAGLHKMIEEVNAHSLNRKPVEGDIPVTIHKFAKGYSNAISLPRGGPSKESNVIIPASMEATKVSADNEATQVLPETMTRVSDRTVDINEVVSQDIARKYQNINNINPLQARQIGLMDFLTGNQDRHGNNLLVSDGFHEDGYRSLLAIDHDRAFHYLQTTAPHEEYENSAMARLLGDHAGQKTDEHDRKLAMWWNNNRLGIYDEMNRNLGAVKDDHLRNYIRKNFDMRYQMISEWASSYHNHNKSFFERDIGSIINSHPLNFVDHDSVNRIKDTLPENKSEAMNMLFAYMKKPRAEIEDHQLYAIQKIAADFLKEMPSKDAVRFFSKVDSDPRIRNFKHDVLQDMRREPEKHVNKIKELLDVNEELPKDSRFLNDFWALHLKRALEGVQEHGGVA